VIGYLSASVEWSVITNQPEAWRSWWQNQSAKTYYFIGKDNIPFHAIIWPGQLIGCGTTFDRLMNLSAPKSFVLPYDIPANEFMNIEGQKISGSRNWAVWTLDFLTRYDPDPLRYYLTVNMPESRDTDWDWDDFFHRNNDELVATWGNLANRVLSFAYRNWDSLVPEPGELTSQDRDLIQSVEDGFKTVGAELEAVHLRSALAEAMRLASEVNKYLDQTAPWLAIKTDKASAGRAIYTAIRAIDNLKVFFAPFLPFTCEKLHRYLGYEQPLFGTLSVEIKTDELGDHKVLRYHPDTATAKWEFSQIEPGRKLQPPEPLFRKLEPKIIEEERARLGKPV
jgi:methionyl-tRNA synthetase